MKRFFIPALAAVFLVGFGSSACSDEAQAKAVVDKAIKAIGGQENLAKGVVLTWKTKGKITLGDNENDFKGQTTVEGLERYRAEFEGDFNGNEVKGVTVIDGKKGWRKFGDNATEMDEDAIANEKRNIYLQIVAATLAPLNGKVFKVETAGEEKVGDKPATLIKATGPDGKPFTLSFDKETGLLVKQTATVSGFNGEEYEQQTAFADYKDFGGIKKATKVVSTRDGNPFITLTVTEFKTSDKANPETFAEPK